VLHFNLPKIYIHFSSRVRFVFFLFDSTRIQFLIQFGKYQNTYFHYQILWTSRRVNGQQSQIRRLFAWGIMIILCLLFVQHIYMHECGILSYKVCIFMKTKSLRTAEQRPVEKECFKNIDWATGNQDNVSEWGNILIGRLSFQWASIMKIQLSLLV
jgi:hypothetical protein